MSSESPEVRPTNVVQDGIRTYLQRAGQYWYGLEPPHTLCVFRILLGIYFLIGWLNAFPRVSLYYSSEGIAFPERAPSTSGGNRLAELMMLLVQPPHPWLAWIFYLFMVMLSVLIIIGSCTRTALTIYCAMFVYYWFLQLHTINSSYDRLTFIITAILAASECGAVYSIDAWNRTRRGVVAVEKCPIWPARLIAMQIAFMYVGTGIFKVSSPAWNDGSILRYSLQGDWGSPLAFWLLQFDLSESVFAGAVLLTILVEVWAPFLLFHPQLKYLFFIVGFLFHLSVALMLNIWGFLIIPMTYLLFVDPATFKRFCSRSAIVT